MPMMAITTSSSTSVKPRRRKSGRCIKVLLEEVRPNRTNRFALCHERALNGIYFPQTGIQFRLMEEKWMERSPRRGYKDLSLAQLRSFSVVCRRGGYAAAARELFLTTPAVWEQMHALQQHYGFPLLERRGNAVRPTAKGERLLEMVGPLLAGLESTGEVLKQQDGALPRQLTLVTNLRVLADEISRALRQFQRSYPAVRLRVLYTGIEEVEPLLLDGEADVTLTLEPGPDSPPSTTLSYEAAGEVDYLLIAPPRHALLRQRVLRLERIVEFPLALGEPTAYSRHRVQEVMHRHGLTQAMHLAVETSSDEYTLSCVRAGL